jgi:serine/threonine protein kinase
MIFDGKYQQIKLLGAGAFGKVFLAEELLTKRKVAIKIIQQSSLSSGKLLINEIKQISKFQHDHIIAYYHHFQQNGLLHLVMEYCEGGTLRQRLHSKKYTASDVIDWAISLTNALREIHKKGVFHKDIKPDNILFTKNGTIKLGDLA